MIRAGVLLLLLLNFQPAGAHSGTLSYSDWQISPGEVETRLRLRLADFRFLRIDGELADFLRDGIHIDTPGGTCQPRPDASTRAQGPELWLQWSWDCPAPPTQIRLSWLDQLPGHLHLLSHPGRTVLLGRGTRQALLASAAESTAHSAGATLLQHGRSGLHHIAQGWDHLAFLLGLLLLAHRLSMLVWLVTGFTLGHSLSLLLSVFHAVQPPAASIELGIAASIVFAGLASRGTGIPRIALGLTLLLAGLGLWANPEDPLLWCGLGLIGAAHLLLHRREPARSGAVAALLFASLFGLLHGFGFAGAIIQASGEAERVWPVLLGFNLGVEAGQLLFVLPAWLLLQALRRSAWQFWSTTTLRAAVCGLGSYWFFARLLAA